MICLPIL